MKRIIPLFIAANIFINPALADKIGVVGAANPNVKAIGGVAGDRDLKLGDDIFFKETISTNENGKAQLMFVDRSALTVGPNSSILIDEFIYNPADSSGEITMQGTKGAFRFIGGALSKKNAVKIKTPVGTIGIRGGIALVNIAPDGQTSASFLYGQSMTFQNLAGAFQEVTDNGLAIKVDTPESAPVIQEVNVADLAKAINQFGGTEGMAGGAKNMPTEGDLGEGIGKIKEDDSAVGEGNNAADKGDSSTSNEGGEQSGSEEQNSGDSEPVQGEGESNQPLSPEGGEDGANPPPPDSSSNLDNWGGDGIKIIQPQLLPEIKPVCDNCYKPINQDTSIPVGGIYYKKNSSIIKDGSIIGKKYATIFDLKYKEAYPTSPTSYDVSDVVIRSGESAGYLPFFKVSETGPLLNGQGWQYNSLGNNMSLYLLEDGKTTYNFNDFGVGTSAQYSLVVGTPMNHSTIVSQTGIRYYSFAPDLATYYDVTTTKPGFFDYNIANSHMLDSFASNVTSISNTMQTNRGLVVDWGRKAFLGGSLTWEYNNSSDFKTELIVIGGRVENTVTANYYHMTGGAYKFFSDESTSDSIVDGDIHVQAANNGEAGEVYGNAVAGVDGFIITGDIPDNSFNIDQPVFRTESANSAGYLSADMARYANRNSNLMRGWMAGFLIPDSQSSDVGIKYWTNDISDFYIQKDAVNNTIGASLTLDPVGGGTTLLANFGSLATGTIPNPNAEYAFISNDTYAIEQGSYTRTGSLGSADIIDGILVGARNLTNTNNDSTMQCTACEYVHWGVWASEMDQPGGAPGDIDVAHVMPYVMGEVTQNLQSIGGLPATGNFSGIALGQFYDGGADTIAPRTGTFTATVDFSARNLTNFALNIAGDTMTFSGTKSIPATGMAQFTNVTITGGTYSGTINGSLFGPAAQNIGGNFELTDGGSVAATGIYLGKR